MSELPQPLSLLYQADDLDFPQLPEPLSTWYGGSLPLSGPRLVANFVATLDGVVAMPEVNDSNALISAGSIADRFVMGLLRAYADVVLIGSGTLRGSPRTRWTAEDACPAGRAAYDAWRQHRGLPPTPSLAVMTASGDINLNHPALVAGATVLTTSAGAATLGNRLPASCTLVTLPGDRAVNARAAVAALHDQGHEAIVSEAGPRVFGSLLAAGLVDDLFLTQSPLLAGQTAGVPRWSLVEDTILLPGVRVESQLASIRRHREHLFIHYRLGNAGEST